MTEHSNIVERLREWAGTYEEGSFDTEEALMSDAASEISRLRIELDEACEQRGDAMGKLVAAEIETNDVRAELGSAVKAIKNMQAAQSTNHGSVHVILAEIARIGNAVLKELGQ